MSNILYVYGTLRPWGPNTIKIPGQLFDLGRFPGVKLDLPGEVVCEKIEVKDWSAIDRYEGYYPEDHEGSLYIRRPFMDGFIYEFNRDVDPEKRIEFGDWLVYTKERWGTHGGSFTQGS